MSCSTRSPPWRRGPAVAPARGDTGRWPRRRRRGAPYNSPMARVSEIEDPGSDPILNDIFAKEQAAFGFVLNTTKVQAHRPGIMKAAKQLAAAIEASGLLSAELRALVYLRVALINGCPF